MYSLVKVGVSMIKWNESVYEKLTRNSNNSNKKFKKKVSARVLIFICCLGHTSHVLLMYVYTKENK